MANQRLLHDCAVSGTQHCLELLCNILDDEELKLQATNGLYEIMKATIESYVLLDDRMQKRLRPLQY